MGPLLLISPYYSTFFCGYISLVVFAILNIVTGVFVENAIKSTQHDADIMMWEEAESRNQLVEDVRKVFIKADTDRSGDLNWQEFEKHIGDHHVQAYLRKLDLDVESSGARGMFKLLDFDGDGKVDIEEFVVGIARLKGLARSLDLARLSHNQRAQSDQLKRLEKKSEDVQTYVQEATESMHILFQETTENMHVRWQEAGQEVGNWTQPSMDDSFTGVAPAKTLQFPPERKYDGDCSQMPAVDL